MSLRKFDSLTPASKRMRIARDVLAQLNTNAITAKRGTYLRPSYTDDSLPETPIKEAKSCTACALGSLMFCRLKYNGDTTFSTLTTTPAPRHGSNQHTKKAVANG